MDRQKYKAFVLRSAKYKEHDKMLTLFTRSDGKISVSAKGVMSLKCKYAASAQLFSLSEFVLGETKSGFYVCSADLIRPFDKIVKDYERLTAASYFCELIDIMYRSGMNEDITFNLIYYAFDLIENAPVSYMLLISLTLALKLTGISGIYPGFTSCVNCSGTAEKYVFDYAKGGVVCPSCMELNDFPMITRIEAEYMQALLHVDLRSITKTALADKEEINMLFKYVNEYIRYNIGKLPRSTEQLYAI